MSHQYKVWWTRLNLLTIQHMLVSHMISAEVSVTLGRDVRGILDTDLAKGHGTAVTGKVNLLQSCDLAQCIWHCTYIGIRMRRAGVALWVYT